MARLRLVPLTLKEANELVAKLHRHHRPVVGHRFSHDRFRVVEYRSAR